MSLLEQIKQFAHEYSDDILTIRRHLHAHPELSFAEFKTADFVASTLESWSISCQRNVAGTGIVALIEGQDPKSRVFALRGDMDALPIEELNAVEYKSTNPGVMHACGHDVHTACLLGAARILQETRTMWSGTCKLIFQPGEEILPGGASMMIKAGVLENPAPQNIIGQHVFPDLPVGKVGFKSGMYMASADEIYITVRGKGGHAALPQRNTDSVLMAAHVVVALQQVVSRNANPVIPTVLSIGKVVANGATNIIPNEVFLEGTFRTFDEEWRMEAHNRIRKICNNICESMGGSCACDIKVGYPYLINDEDLTSKAKERASTYLGSENVMDLPLRMTAEDFAFYSQRIPSCFYRLGTSSSNGRTQFGLHNARFNVDEECLEIGMGMMAWLALE